MIKNDLLKRIDLEKLYAEFKKLCFSDRRRSFLVAAIGFIVVAVILSISFVNKESMEEGVSAVSYSGESPSVETDVVEEEQSDDQNIFERSYFLLSEVVPLGEIMDKVSVQDKQRIFNIPEDFVSIQEAIDAAVSGDAVFVSAGEYKGNITMKDGVSLIGAGAENTILDGEKVGNVVAFKNIVDVDTRLEGFTIKNSEENLSGVMIEDSSPIINRNIILDNDYDIYIKGESSPTIQRNRLSSSKAGVQIFNLEKPNNSLPVIIDNFIFQNKKGINAYKANVKIEHNTISYNDSYGSYAGATFGVYLTSGSAEIKNNIITDNGTCELCSGIYADEKSSGVVIDYNNLWNNKNNFLCFGECKMLGNNFSGDSAFINAAEYDFSLSEDSPFLESGSDGKKLGSRI
ncbi:MAG: right-handed parallel beta-helix repeat-containing protein [Candidatus Pacebacteria bacterium]|nr:right-handed parallel beta-helix repeat-containing protein [Candidatus Paceibacterota bacterium]